MTDGLFKRTTFIVEDADKAADFYRAVFDWNTWYDNNLAVDGRFPPLAPDQAMARLIMLKGPDPKIGMLGFMSYHEPVEALQETGARPERLRLGDAILVIEAPDLDLVYERAKANGASIVTAPVGWTVPGPDGGTINLRSMSMFDSNGIYSEISQARS